MAHTGYTVYVVEDDSSVRDALALLLSLEGYAVAMFDSVERFVSALRQEWLGCILIDTRLSGSDGWSLQQRLCDKACAIPMVMMNLLGNISSVPRALYSATSDLLHRPAVHARLVSMVEQAFLRQDSVKALRAAPVLDMPRPVMDEDEREIVAMLSQGLPRREIAKALYVSPDVVEARVERLQSRFGAADVEELLQRARLN